MKMGGLPIFAKLEHAPSVLEDSLYAKIFINALIRRHLSMNDFTPRFISLMIKIGCEITANTANTAVDLDLVGSINEIAETRMLDKHKTIAGAPNISFKTVY